MPAYEYNKCEACGWDEGTILGVPILERDNQTCPELLHDIDCDMGEDCTCTPKPCGHPLERIEISTTQEGKADYRHQTKAILADGSKIAGHFGKLASTNKGRY